MAGADMGAPDGRDLHGKAHATPTASDIQVHATPSISTTAQRHVGPGRGLALAALAGVTTLTGYVFLADPDQGGAYPRCPSKMVLGVDCPFCGGLRGTNALLHGRIAEALDHNVLLPALLATFAVMAALGVLAVVGRPLPTIAVPRWLKVAAVGVLVAFAVTRNLPIDSLEYLASEA